MYDIMQNLDLFCEWISWILLQKRINTVHHCNRYMWTTFSSHFCYTTLLRLIDNICLHLPILGAFSLISFAGFPWCHHCANQSHLLAMCWLWEKCRWKGPLGNSHQPTGTRMNGILWWGLHDLCKFLGWQSWFWLLKWMHSFWNCASGFLLATLSIHTVYSSGGSLQILQFGSTIPSSRQGKKVFLSV